MTITQLTGLLGLIFGVVGTTLGILNYLRDRAYVQVSLQWNMNVANSPMHDPDKFYGSVSVGNVGRRPIFVSHVALRLPKGSHPSHFLLMDSITLLMDSITGIRLAEGDPVRTYPVDQEGLEKYAPHWRDVIAQVSDASGSVWTSKRLPKTKVPSWAKAE